MKIRRARHAPQGRIQIIPMIDVMFFLLATFMLASLSMQNLHSLPVHLPEGKADPMQARSPVTLTVTKDKAIFLNSIPVTVATVAEVLKPLLNASNGHVIVAADGAAPHEVVVKAMIEARRAGAQNFLIAVKTK
jgi:biopolymer transport protein ExbD